MILIERRIANLARYRKVYLPSEAQLAELVDDLRPFDLLRAFWPTAIVSNRIRPVIQGQARTTFVDLSKDLDAIFAGMHGSCRYKIRRAEKMRDRFEIAMNTDVARDDFLPFYNDFARKKGNLPQLRCRRFNELAPHADIFMLYFEGRPTCGRMVLRDQESRTVLMLYSATTRLNEDADTITTGLLNRYLYWHEMKTYHVLGMKKYDFAGAGDNHPSLAQFKLSFGGGLSWFSYCLYAGTAPIFWKVAHSLYRFEQDRRLHGVTARQRKSILEVAIS
ncbi:MAG TPA: hypothetical protein VJ728_04415 [Candidatus Binataceae bacterium]|nr:hypothetical protein [Candidatus Binataceae bacterium]